MSIVCWTIDSPVGSPYSGETLRKSRAAFLGPAPTGRPLGGLSGVRDMPTSGIVTVTGSGPYTAVVGPHAGSLDVETSATAGCYEYANDANVSLSINAADATNPRIDIVYVKVIDTNEGDSGTSGVTLGYTAGTAAATPAAPATPTDAMVLATLAVPKSGTGSPSATFVAPIAGKIRWQYEKTAVNSIANGAFARFTMDLLDLDTSNLGLSGSGQSFQVPTSGTYRVSGSTAWAANSTGRRGAAIYVNTTQVTASKTLQAACPVGSTVVSTQTVLVTASVGDIISVWGFHDVQTPSGGALSTAGGALTVELA